MAIQRKVCNSEIKEYNEKDLSVVHFISSELPDRGGDILYAAKNSKGAGMVMFGRPVVLQQHGWGQMGMEPIAKPVWIKVSKFKDRDGIECKTQFFPDDLGKRLFKKTSEGYMPNWSVGWMPMEGKVEVKNDVRHVYEWELLEYSIVSVPMQPDAQTGEIGTFLFKMIPEEEDRFGELVGWKKDEDRTWEEKPYPNEHACRLEDPDKYIRIRRQNDKFGKGIHAIWGVQGGGKPVELQAIRFSKSKFTAAEARAWVKDHKYKCKLFEPSSEKCEKCGQEKGIIWDVKLEEGQTLESFVCSDGTCTAEFHYQHICEKAKEVVCQGCEKPVKYVDVPESGMGYIKCPNCGKFINQEGKIKWVDISKDPDIIVCAKCDTPYLRLPDKEINGAKVYQWTKQCECKEDKQGKSIDQAGKVLDDKEEKRKIEINLSNIIDSKLLEGYLASPKGLKIILKLLESKESKETKQTDDGATEELPADPESDEDVGFVMVDADAVRKDNGTEDFIHGGHHYIFDFIPEPEIWIDQRMTDEDIMRQKMLLFAERQMIKYCSMTEAQCKEIGLIAGLWTTHVMNPEAEGSGHHDEKDLHYFMHDGNHFHSRGQTIRWDNQTERYEVHSIDIEGMVISLAKDQKEAFEKDIDEAIKQIAVKYGLRETPPAEPEAGKEKQAVNPPEPRKIVIFTEGDRKKAEQDRKKQLSEMLEPVAIQIEGMIKKIPEIVKEEMDRLRGKVK